MTHYGTVVRVLLGLTSLVVLFSSTEAHAYSWMIREGYTGCATCHESPSGGGLLTRYGRAIEENELRTQYGEPDDTSRLGEFFFGAFEVPESLSMGGSLRGGVLGVFVDGEASDPEPLLMEADVDAQLRADRVRVHLSVGFQQDGARRATVFGTDKARMVSREHWIGVDLDDSQMFLLRVGRLPIPFGLRIVEHSSHVRRTTQTDNNENQTHGAALALTLENLRAEAMLIVGNLQIAPDLFRERGYSAFVEWAPSTTVAVGASSMVTHVDKDVQRNSKMWRHAHGATLRIVPTDMLVMLAEVDALLFSTPYQNAWGITSFAQLDLEPVHGLHLLATGEVSDLDFVEPGWLAAVSGGAQWFAAPHFDIRFDAGWQRVPAGPTSLSVFSILAQAHLSL